MSIIAFARNWLTRSAKPFVFKNEYDEVLDYEHLNRLGLYVHIPFCRSLCSFCPYCKSIYNKEQAHRYIQALIQEIHLVGNQLNEKKEITSLYFGGGTPCLCIDELKAVIDALHQHFTITQGIGIELHPNDVTDEILSQLKNIGITKISIGVQSFDTHCLKLLGRSNTNQNDWLQLLSSYDFETVSMDFIFAIPGQTLDSLKKDIEIAFSHGANHIALYPLIEFSFHPMNEKMDEKKKRELLDQILEYCQSMGYQRTSIWTFSKGWHHYSSMTRENFLGFGCSATTLLKEQFKINTFDIEEYIKRIQRSSLPTALTCRFTKHQRMVYYLFWNAYSTIVDPKDFKAFFNESLFKNYGFELMIARLCGFIKKVDGKYQLTNKGTYYYHYFEGFYTLAYIDKMWNIMSRESYPGKIVL